MKMNFHTLLAALFSCCILMTSFNPAWAGKEENKAQAKKHFFKAKTYIENGEWGKAIIALKASYELNPVSVVLFNLAVCYDGLTLYASALEYYNRFLNEGKDAPEEMLEAAAKRIEELKKFIGMVNMDVDVDGAIVEIDGKIKGRTPMGTLFLQTGERVIIIHKQGYITHEQVIDVVPGDTFELDVDLEVDKENPPPLIKDEGAGEPLFVLIKKGQKRKKIGGGPFWTCVTMTVVSGMVAGVTGTMALQKEREVAGMYEHEDWKGIARQADNFALAADIFIGVGCTSAIAAIVLAFFTDFRLITEKGTQVSLLNRGSGAFMNIEWGSL